MLLAIGFEIADYDQYKSLTRAWKTGTRKLLNSCDLITLLPRLFSRFIAI